MLGLQVIDSFLNPEKAQGTVSHSNNLDEWRKKCPNGLAKRVIACLDVRANDQGDLVVTKGDQYDVRESSTCCVIHLMLFL